MSVLARLGILVAAFAATAATAQLTIPQIVQLPTEDFVWTWGTRNQGALQEERGLRRPDFDIRGFEQGFWCDLTGSWRLGSRMRDFYNTRDFEQSLNGSLYFIQDATYTINSYYRQNQIDWATLDCKIPEAEETADESQERLDRAVERALRDRERRRAREEEEDDD